MDTGANSYQRYLQGDDVGIAEIVSEYKDGLILYLNGYVDNIYIAEELTEETFFRLITKKPKYLHRSTFKTWLYAIGRNVAIDHIRMRKRIASTPIEDMENYLIDESTLQKSYIREDKIYVHKAMSKLNLEYRTILWLVYFEGFSNQECAIILGKNDRQIRNLLYRAKVSLKEKLEQEGFVYEDL